VSEAQTDPTKMPADYAIGGLPVPQADWTAADIIDIASLVGGIFGKGGGQEVANSALYKYLLSVLGPTEALKVFHNFKATNDPDASTTLARSFPYMTAQPASLDPSLNVIPNSSALTGLPAATGSGCGGVNTLFHGLSPVNMSNALLVSGKYTTDGHHIAVMGPQVGYYAPQILMEVDLHAPDYEARGVSFPGTNFIVELGRGRDFAWSATSASSDVVDQKVVRAFQDNTCTSFDPTPSNNKWYQFGAGCLQLRKVADAETAPVTLACNPPPPSPSGCLAPDINLDHSTWRVLDGSDHVMGIVQGWTTATGGLTTTYPVIIYNQRSTYQHELDSGTGFDRWQHPSATHDYRSWTEGAAQIQYTFNWHYIDASHIGYYVSGKDPIRNPAVDPGLPTWGGGAAEWTGYLAKNAHPHEVDPAQGYIVQWNNKPAPGFAAADDVFNYSLVHRQQRLVQNLKDQLSSHGGHITRANLVTAMETAASQDVSAASILPRLTSELGALATGPRAMMDMLNGWSARGAHRRKAAIGDAEYADIASVAAMDELYPRVVQAIFDSMFNPTHAGANYRTTEGIHSGYTIFPMNWAGLPHSHGGSSYGSGWEGYVLKVLLQLQSGAVAQPFDSSLMSRICDSGPAGCQAALDAAVQDTYDMMKARNSGQTDPTAWTKNTALVSTGGTMRSFDDIEFTRAGIVGQPSFDWQNRPTFQQVVEFGISPPAAANVTNQAKAGRAVAAAGSAPPARAASVPAVTHANERPAAARLGLAQLWPALIVLATLGGLALRRRRSGSGYHERTPEGRR
jgi:hypothetical protein